MDGFDGGWSDGGWDERLARTRAAAAGVGEAGRCLAPLGALQWESPAGRAFRQQLELLAAQVRYLTGVIETAEAAVLRARAVALLAEQARRLAGEAWDEGVRRAVDAGVDLVGDLTASPTWVDTPYVAGILRGGPDPVPHRPAAP